MVLFQIHRAPCAGRRPLTMGLVAGIAACWGGVNARVFAVISVGGRVDPAVPAVAGAASAMDRVNGELAYCRPEAASLGVQVQR